MFRLWRTSAGPPLVTFLLIDIAIIMYTSTAGARVNTADGHAQVLLPDSSSSRPRAGQRQRA
jgi:hypothetical protein